MSDPKHTKARKYRTALLGRTSKDDPKHVPIESQQEILRKWGRADPFIDSIAGEYWDDGISGTIPLWDRPAGKRLMADVEAGVVQAVAVAYVDRFGRTLLDGLLAVKALEDRGVKLVAVNDGWDARRNDSPLYFQFRMMLAEEEHRRIRERMENGKLRSMEKNNAPPSGRLVFGYRMGPHGEFIVDPVEGPIVSRMFEMALDGKSNNEILRYLIATGVAAGGKFQKRSDGGAPVIRKGDEGAEWHHSRICRILTNRTYLGERTWNGRTFPCPPLVDRETWSKVQARNAAQPAPRPRYSTDGLLSGLLRCECCGGRYYQSRRRNKRVYRCKLSAKGKCRSKVLPLVETDNQVWALVETYLHDPADLIRKVLETDARACQADADLAAEADRINKARENLNSQVAALWAEQKARGWPINYIADGLDQINAERLKLDSRMQEVQKRRTAMMLEKDAAAMIPAALAGWRVKMAAGLSHEEKSEVMRLVFAREAGSVATIDTGGKHGVARKLKARVSINLRWGDQAAADAASGGNGARAPQLPQDQFYGSWGVGDVSVVFSLGA